MTGINELMWTERYRPDRLDDVIGNDGIVDSLNHWAESGELPNLLLSGPAGTGKTALATAFAKDYYGENWRQNFMEMNASDDRGIDVVRDQIKTYAEQGTTGDYGFSIIFLDEADSLTKEAQSALRRVMEDYVDTTRFILSCNYANKLIDPIQSRCTVFRVSPLNDGQIRDILQRVVDGEDLDTEGNVLDILVEHADGDARKAINSLQALSSGGTVSADAVEGIISPIDSDAVEEIARDAISGNLSEARERINSEFLKQGIDSGDLASAMMRALNRVDMPEDSRCLAFDKLGECEYRVLNGASPHVQWASFLANLQLARHMSFDAYQ